MLYCSGPPAQNGRAISPVPMHREEIDDRRLQSPLLSGLRPQISQRARDDCSIGRASERAFQALASSFVTRSSRKRSAVRPAGRPRPYLAFRVVATARMCERVSEGGDSFFGRRVTRHDDRRQNGSTRDDDDGGGLRGDGGSSGTYEVAKRQIAKMAPPTEWKSSAASVRPSASFRNGGARDNILA